MQARVAKTGTTQPMLDMARIVVRNAGRPLVVQAIPEKIRSTFGIAAAKSLPRMLIKRARRSKCGLYLTSDGLIGLIETAPIGSTPGRSGGGQYVGVGKLFGYGGL